jgi:hypothetical protein
MKDQLILDSMKDQLILHIVDETIEKLQEETRLESVASIKEEQNLALISKMNEGLTPTCNE